MKFKRLHQKGDTIIEVILVLAVLGFALSLAYEIANRSLLDTQQAEQASSAEDLLQYQAEALESMSVNPIGSGTNFYLFNSGFGPFCLNSYTPVGSEPGRFEMFTYTPTNCTFASDGYNYKIVINYQNNPISNGGAYLDHTGGTFTITASWPDAIEDTTDTATLIYNTYYNVLGT